MSEFVIKNFNDFVSDNKSSDNKSSDNEKIENIYDFFEIIIDKILEKCQNNNDKNKSCDHNNEKEINEYKMSTLRAQFRYFIQKYIDLINFKKKIKIKSEKQLEHFEGKTHSMQLREKKSKNQEDVENINQEDVEKINNLIDKYNKIFFTKTTEGGKPNTKTKKKTKKKYNYKKKTKRNKRRKTYKKNKASI